MINNQIKRFADLGNCKIYYLDNTLYNCIMKNCSDPNTNKKLTYRSISPYTLFGISIIINQNENN